MKPIKKFDEFTFVRELTEKLLQAYPNYKIYAEKRYGRFIPDISIDRTSDKIIIEVKNARNYSTLPFSTLTQLEDYKNNIPDSKVILISFSNINDLMKEKLKELDIKTYINPDYETIINDLKE
jgi:hypothetical protein